MIESTNEDVLELARHVDVCIKNPARNRNNDANSDNILLVSNIECVQMLTKQNIACASS